MSEFGELAVPGIPDECFARGAVPLTREEIRCLTLSKLRLGKRSRVVDIGAGSGGLTVECALLLDGGRVWAVERNEEALGLIRKNCALFGLDNVTIIAGEAPGALEEIGPVDRVIVGGSGGSLAGIITRSGAMLEGGGTIVVNCILLETLQESLVLLKRQGFTGVSYIQVQVSRSRELGKGTCLQPLNPVFIVSAQKGAVR